MNKIIVVWYGSIPEFLVNNSCHSLKLGLYRDVKKYRPIDARTFELGLYLMHFSHSTDSSCLPSLVHPVSCPALFPTLFLCLPARPMQCVWLLQKLWYHSFPLIVCWTQQRNWSHGCLQGWQLFRRTFYTEHCFKFAFFWKLPNCILQARVTVTS